MTNFERLKKAEKPHDAMRIIQEKYPVLNDNGLLDWLNTGEAISNELRKFVHYAREIGFKYVAQDGDSRIFMYTVNPEYDGFAWSADLNENIYEVKNDLFDSLFLQYPRQSFSLKSLESMTSNG